MKFESDKRIVLTLDAGGTNLVFSAIQGCKEIVEPITLPTEAHDLDLCLGNILKGFRELKKTLPEDPVAISFAFPGPADYPRGIISDLGNLPAFRGGVALGPMLEQTFGLPVFINNDGDLYTYGEAIAGYLPYINGLLEKAGSHKRFRNIVGFTLGTGFGAGIVHDGNLLLGDNSMAAEVWLLRNKVMPDYCAEEGISIRGIQRVYAEETGIDPKQVPTPKEIFEIGIGNAKGDKNAAVKTFRIMGETLGDAIANVITLIDSIAVIGGGLAGASPLFFDDMIREMNSTFVLPDGTKIPRLEARAYNLEDENELKTFLTGELKEVVVPGSNTRVVYDPLVRVGVGISKIGTSRATSIGAYVFALKTLDN